MYNAYDSFGRMTSRKLNTATPFTTTYDYWNASQLRQIQNGSNKWNYGYDADGNISSVSYNGRYSRMYDYDSAGQLIREFDYDANTLINYTYDNRGNILNKKIYPNMSTANTPTTVTYTYGNTDWKDLLTNYNGTAITYDAIGNPSNWRDGMTFSWSNGRQLRVAKKYGSVVGRYTYDSNGMRITKTTEDGFTTYHVMNGVCYGETRKNGQNLQYVFDENGRVISFRMQKDGKSSRYYFVFNAQGDVVQLLGYSGQVYANYSYDTWGRCTATSATGGTLSSDSVGMINPFRYRGYYYDNETGLYYLQSRYYDPVVGRFVNADSQIAGISGDIRGYNMFVYCMNNPVNMSDFTGGWPSWNDIGNFFKNVGSKVADGVKAVGKFFSDHFGAQTTTTVVEYENKSTTDFFFFKVTETNTVSHDIETGGAKTVTAYADTTSQKVGIKVKAGSVSGNIGTGLDGLISEKISIKVQNTTYSFGHKEKVILGDYSFSMASGNATKSYILELNKINIAAAIVAPYLLPVGAGGKLIEVFG